jgi:hypothetical protein
VQQKKETCLFFLHFLGHLSVLVALHLHLGPSKSRPSSLTISNEIGFSPAIGMPVYTSTVPVALA